MSPFSSMRDGRGGEAAVAAAILAGEAARVHQDLVRGGGVEVAAAGVLDAGVEGHGGGLGATGDLDALGGRHARSRRRSRGAGRRSSWPNSSRFGQAGEGIFAGDPRERDGSFDEARDRFVREVGGGGAGRALADEDPQTDCARAGLFQGFNLPQSHQRGKLVAFIDDSLGIGGSCLESAAEDIGGKLAEVRGRLSRHGLFRIIGLR